MEIEEIRRRIEELANEKQMMEETLREAMVSAIQEIGQENPNKVQRVGGIKVMTIKSSQLIDKPWSFEFFDWEQSASAVLKYLAGTPVTSWKQKLTDLLDTKGKVVELKKRGKIWYGMTGIVERTPIDRRFIEKIIEKI